MENNIYQHQGFQRYGAFLIPPVVIFHTVDPNISDKLNIAPDEFHTFLSIMDNKGFHAISLQSFYKLLFQVKNCDFEKYYILTFDDGYDSYLQFAIPVLAKFGAESTLFIPTEHVGKDNSWNPKISFNSNHLTWNEIKQVKNFGVEIGSHGCSHRNFGKLTLPEIEKELFESKKEIEDHLEEEIISFSYPYGDKFSQANYIVSKYYKIAVGVDEGGRVWPENQFFIKRYDYSEILHMVNCSENGQYEGF